MENHVIPDLNLSRQRWCVCDHHFLFCIFVNAARPLEKKVTFKHLNMHTCNNFAKRECINAPNSACLNCICVIFCSCSHYHSLLYEPSVLLKPASVRPQKGVCAYIHVCIHMCMCQLAAYEPCWPVRKPISAWTFLPHLKNRGRAHLVSIHLNNLL